MTYHRLSLRVRQHQKYCLHSNCHLHREWMVPAIGFRYDHFDHRCCLGRVHQISIDLAQGYGHSMNLFLVEKCINFNISFCFCCYFFFFKHKEGRISSKMHSPLCDVCSLDFCSLIGFRSSTLSSRNLSSTIRTNEIFVN